MLKSASRTGSSPVLGAMNSWIAKFIGGPLEGQEMQVSDKTVLHMTTNRASNVIRTYHYTMGRRLGETTWAYIVVEITDEHQG